MRRGILKQKKSFFTALLLWWYISKQCMWLRRSRRCDCAAGNFDSWQHSNFVITAKGVATAAIEKRFSYQMAIHSVVEEDDCRRIDGGPTVQTNAILYGLLFGPFNWFSVHCCSDKFAASRSTSHTSNYPSLISAAANAAAIMRSLWSRDTFRHFRSPAFCPQISLDDSTGRLQNYNFLSVTSYSNFKYFVRLLHSFAFFDQYSFKHNYFFKNKMQYQGSSFESKASRRVRIVSNICFSQFLCSKRMVIHLSISCSSNAHFVCHASSRSQKGILKGRWDATKTPCGQDGKQCSMKACFAGVQYFSLS